MSCFQGNYPEFIGLSIEQLSEKLKKIDAKLFREAKANYNKLIKSKEIKTRKI